MSEGIPMVITAVESVDVTVSAILGILGILGAIKSAWNGTLRRLYQNVMQIEEINSSVGEMKEQQKDIGEAIAVLSWAQEGEIEGVNPRAIEERVGVDRSMADMINDDNFYRDGAPPQTEAERADDERTRHRTAEDRDGGA